jgi:hypothetical protein
VEIKCPFSARMSTDLERFYGSSRVKFIRDGALNLDNTQGKQYHRHCQLYLMQRDARKIVLGVYAPLAPRPLLVTVTPDPHWRESWFRDNPGIKAAALELAGTHGEGTSNGTTDPHEEALASDWCGGELREEDVPDSEGRAGLCVHAVGRGTPDGAEPRDLLV